MFYNFECSLYSFNWSIVNVVDTETIISTALTGVRFNYKRECVSFSDTCAKYTVTTDSEVCSASRDNVFHLEWGGFVFNQDFRYDADYPGRADDDKPTEVFLGSCNVEERNPCNSVTDSLFELTLEIGDSGYSDFRHDWTIREYSNDGDALSTIDGYWGTRNGIAGTTYKIFRCLPIKSTDACSVTLRIWIDANDVESDALAGYSVSLDGIARNGRQRSSYQVDWSNSDLIVTTLADRVCFSRKEEAGIVIGSIIGFAILLFVGYKVYIKRRKSTDAGADADAGGAGADTGATDAAGDIDDRQPDGTASWSGSQDSRCSL